MNRLPFADTGAREHMQRRMRRVDSAPDGGSTRQPAPHTTD